MEKRRALDAAHRPRAGVPRRAAGPLTRDARAGEDPAIPLRRPATRSLAALLALAASACSRGPAPGADAGAAPAGSAGAPIGSAGAPVDPPAPPGAAPVRAPVREGGALARAAREDALYVADEDHGVVRVVPLPLDPARPGAGVPAPGRPAQVLALGGREARVLATVRDPGLLLIFRPDASAGLVEVGRVPLPADAWGIAVTPDEKTAFVTSAWTHKVSAVDLEAGRARWTVDVAREPRGVAVLPDGSAAYVSHLVGADLTRIDDLGGAPRVRRVALPASPLRAPSGERLAASLGYALALSEDGRRLFAARHALGAMGHAAWFGAATVDVLLTGRDEPLAPPHHGNLPVLRSAFAEQVITPESVITLPGASVTPVTQPRAAVYRKRARTLLVAGEGDDLVLEVDATAVDPTLAIVKSYPVGGRYDPHIRVAGACGAPTGLALSADEATAWVFCRSTGDVAALRLHDPAAGAVAGAAAEGPAALVHLADDPLGPEVAKGRRLFYNALDGTVSGNLGCAGCHPDGRDDGYVWREATFSTADGEHANFVGRPENIPEVAKRKGFPRRTPMLAGNVGAAGPYGWHGESEDLVGRLQTGMGLHRWGGLPIDHTQAGLAARATYLAMFLRRGLVTPPRGEGAPDERAKRGREIFHSDEAKCSRCHVPASDYTDRTAYPMPKRPPLPGYDEDPRPEYKTPSLRFVGGRPPYLHDGRAGTLAELIEQNADWMGKTSHLSPEDRAALVAFLETL
ncbi:hypothetical protein SCE1572_24330 [Sorangium cellulosum So0157-2]|uniref:Cytochrome c domain-containing protein n=1 Tax=Sorangium cellulosum So0157-2 TaxID=1254432 RepID=S4XVR8_SORCE|nr:hypothetical protein SCE1572_24330 [Sorangium cellulosum So0157-2]